jgi:hypothetical protein
MPFSWTEILELPRRFCRGFILCKTGQEDLGMSVTSPNYLHQKEEEEEEDSAPPRNKVVFVVSSARRMWYVVSF